MRHKEDKTGYHAKTIYRMLINRWLVHGSGNSRKSCDRAAQLLPPTVPIWLSGTKNMQCPIEGTLALAFSMLANNCVQLSLRLYLGHCFVTQAPSTDTAQKSFNS